MRDIKKLASLLFVLSFFTTNNHVNCLCNSLKSETSVCLNQKEQLEFDLNSYIISSDKTAIKFEQVKSLHEQMYWAQNCSDEKIQKNIDNSDICYGVHDATGNQIGYARVVTDYSTVAYLLDIVVDDKHRGRGIGTKLVNEILKNPELEGCTFVLSASEQARSFYKGLGFQLKDGRYMTYRHTEV